MLGNHSKDIFLKGRGQCPLSSVAPAFHRGVNTLTPQHLPALVLVKPIARYDDFRDIVMMGADNNAALAHGYRNTKSYYDNRLQAYSRLIVTTYHI